MSNLGILIKYEWKKLFQKKIVGIALIVIVGLQLVSNLMPLIMTATRMHVDDLGNEHRSSLSGYEWIVLEKENAKRVDHWVIDGSLMPMLKQGYLEDVNPYQEIYSVAHSIISDRNSMYGADTETLYRSWRKQLDDNVLSDKYLTPGELAYWAPKVESIETPFIYEYCLGWKGVMSQALTNGVLLVMLIAICLAGLFADEHRLKTDQMVLCMKNGRSAAFLAKGIVGTNFGALSALVLYGISFLFAFAYYGWEGFGAMLQLDITMSPYPMTLGQAVLTVFGLTILAGVVESALAVWLSEQLNSGIAVMAILVGITLLTQMVRVPEQWRVLYQIWNLLPTNLTTPWSFMDARLVPVPGAYLTNFEFAAILYPALTLLFWWLGRRKYNRFQVTGR